MKEKLEGAGEFAKKHWKEATLATLTVAGAATWLLIRYYKQRKEKLSDTEEKLLDELEDEATRGHENTPVFFETGVMVVNGVPGAVADAAEMAEVIPDEKGRETMSTLIDAARYEKR